MRPLLMLPLVLFFVFGHWSAAHAQVSLSPFGTKPIQLSVDKDGIKQRKENGYICELISNVSKIKYSEWGETERDARIIVRKACNKGSGLLLCKDDKITCKEDKP